MPNKILVVDDDPGLLTLVKIGLERDGFEVVTATSGEEGLRRAYASHPDAVILDVMMPQMDGWTICQRLRQVSSCPIIMLTARSDANDIVKGLTLGADEYIVKPCSLGELKVRLRKTLERGSRAGASNGNSVYDDGDLYVDPIDGAVLRDGQPVGLTPTESRLLGYLVSQRGRIVPHRELLTHVWGPQYVNEVKYLSVYIRYLREKIETDPSNPRYILTRHRVGYYFAGDTALESGATGL